jgi:hypothetical protein
MPPISHRSRRRRLWALVAAPTALALAFGSSAASAATTPTWAEWTPLTGAAGSWTTTVSIAPSPALTATVASDSRGGSGVGIAAGTNTFLAQGTPPGAIYGSSRNQGYLGLRPRQDSPGVPSETVFTFNRPTPTTGWMFAVGDIDADTLQISAVGPDGEALSADQLGFRSTFSYCADGIAGRPPASTCPAGSTDVPVWNPGTATLVGNGGDTSGASAWFEPTAPISTLTFRFAPLSGQPVFQTWFASLARDVRGAVSGPNGAAASGVEVTLRDANGEPIATTTTDADGGYAFPRVQASAGYRIDVAPPPGLVVEGDAQQEIDLSTADAEADFSLRAFVAPSVSGEVRGADGAAIPDVTVDLSGDAGSYRTTSGADGTFSFAAVPAGRFDLVATPPSGYRVLQAPNPVVVDPDSETPISGLVIVLEAAAVGVDEPEPTDEPDPTILPPTGWDIAPLLGIAVLLLVAGGAMLGRMRPEQT